jgi:hypothetical protein
MASSLAEIRARLQAQENSNSRQGSDSASFPFWNAPAGSSSLVRFLPDADPSNDFFWVERRVIRLPFSGIVGQGDSKPTFVNVPCMEMFGETCPIVTETRPWWKDSQLEDMARSHSPKKSFLFQGFVLESGFVEDDVPENPIRRFVINPSIHKIIVASMMDVDMDTIPFDYDGGYDFRINKQQPGKYADYSTSAFGRKARSLSDEERAAIDTHGLYDLKEFLPNKPSEADVKVIEELFHASVDGEPYDQARWGNHFRPFGMTANDNGSSKDARTPAPKAEAPAPAPKAEAPAPAPAPKADDVGESPKSAASILETIRNRPKQES